MSIHCWNIQHGKTISLNLIEPKLRRVLVNPNVYLQIVHVHSPVVCSSTSQDVWEEFLIKD